jgi:hypothetical protein
MVVRIGPYEMAPYERRSPCDGTETTRFKSGPGSPMRRRLTIRQLLAPTLSGIRWSMLPWESVRPRPRRRQGVPRSHGPAKETFNGQEVKLRLTANGLHCARTTGGAGVARTGGRPRGRCRARPTETARLKSGPGSLTLGRLTSRQSLTRMGGGRWSMRPWGSVRPRPRRRQGVPRSHGPAEETLNGQEVKLRLTANGLHCARTTDGAGVARAGGRSPGRRAGRPTAPSLRRSTAGRPPERTTALGAPVPGSHC